MFAGVITTPASVITAATTTDVTSYMAASYVTSMPTAGSLTTTAIAGFELENWLEMLVIKIYLNTFMREK